MKKVDAGIFVNSRFVEQNNEDIDATGIIAKAPTIHRFSQRVVLYIAESFPGSTPLIPDILQAKSNQRVSLNHNFTFRHPLKWI